MQKVPYTNPHAHTEFIGGVMVPAGETREIDPTHHPDYRPETAAAVEAGSRHIVDVLLSGTGAAIVAALPSLALEDVELLGEKEQQGAARKAVLEAVSERLLNEASVRVDGNGEHAPGHDGQSSTDDTPPAGGDAKAPAKKGATK